MASSNDAAVIQDFVQETLVRNYVTYAILTILVYDVCKYLSS